MPTDAIECPLCLGEGTLKRTEVLDRLGVKDFARVAQLSAEEAFRLLLQKHNHDEQNVWARFESELTKRTAEIERRHVDQLQPLVVRIKELESAANLSVEQKTLEIQRIKTELEDKLRSEHSQKEDLGRRVEDYFREISQLREHNQKLETELAKVARVGKLEEVSFAEEARAWVGVCLSEKLPKHGDYILAFSGPSGAPLEPRMVVDTKDKESGVTEADIKKLIRDTKERNLAVGIIVAKDMNQLRQLDRDYRWGQEDGVWLLRTTRQWLPRDLEVLRPLLERMGTEGPDFIQRNVALADEVRRTFADIDAIEKELGKASKAIQSVSGLVGKYKVRLNSLCDRTGAAKKSPVPQRDRSDMPQSVGGL